ncbi:GNAT family N-acetyltransferase (plasmid) [Streptomyces sp. NBC_00053]|uniref:GNAT family N-acetyltransferase n=1 Tax=unclassified Streptomyces TaxID=2593676 RepID=UPI00225131C1|nr:MULTISPECIES: GNAT family N-acetyltransferase [unclassified Streptomyces]MCX5505851.1 GNAT family N-acetyltransferase [Streptomyces sp. NBC_00052]
MTRALSTPPVIGSGLLGGSPQPVLPTTGDLLLRPWEEADAPAFLSAHQDDEIRRWHTRRPATEPQVREWLRTSDSPARAARTTAASAGLLSLGGVGRIWGGDGPASAAAGHHFCRRGVQEDQEPGRPVHRVDGSGTKWLFPGSQKDVDAVGKAIDRVATSQGVVHSAPEDARVPVGRDQAVPDDEVSPGDQGCACRSACRGLFAEHGDEVVASHTAIR